MSSRSEKKTLAREMVCCGCGTPSPELKRVCDCATGLLYDRNDVSHIVVAICDEVKEVDPIHAALNTAIAHIEHMAAFIGMMNEKHNAGYSFESLGEDMPGIRAALSKAESAQ